MKNLNNSKIKEKQYKDKEDNDEYSSLIIKLKNIFNYYSNNSKYLSNEQYKIFLIEISLLDNKLTLEYLNTLFYSVSYAKDSINFNSFLSLLTKISEIKFPKIFKQNKEKVLFIFYDKYINPLIDIYINSNKKGSIFKEKENDNNICFNSINHKIIISKISSLLTKEIIEENYLLFLKIYQKYFCFENLKISRIQKNRLSHKAFLKCMEDFKILSEYLNSEQIEQIYDRIIDNKDYTENIMNKLINIDLCNNDGMWFTLFHFIVGIYLIAIFNVIITNYNNNNRSDIWELFLHNNDSIAFENLIKIIYKSENLKNVMSEEIRNMQIEILKYKNKVPNSDEEKNNDLKLNDSNISNKINEKENKNENEKIKNKSLYNYYSNNSKENSLKSNKTYNINNEKLLPNNEKKIIRKNRSLTMKCHNKKKISSIINSSSVNLDKLLFYGQMAPILIKKYKKKLISVYKFYSELYYETIFSIYMTQNGFINLLKDLNLLAKNMNQINNYQELYHQNYILMKKRANVLTFTAINYIFSKFSSVPSELNDKAKAGNKRINFMNFVNIILILANKIFNPKFNNISYDDKSFSYNDLINCKFPIKYGYNFVAIYINPLYQNILPLIEEDNFNMNNLKILLENERLNVIANKIISLFIRVLKCYNDNKPNIEYSQYFKCLCDFNIFPDFITRTKMIKIFINFIDDFDDIYLLKGNNKVRNNVEDCAYSLFYIGIAGNNIENNINNNLEIKILNYLQRIVQSNNLGKLSIKNLRNTLQKDFIYSFYQIQEFILNEFENNRNN